MFRTTRYLGLAAMMIVAGAPLVAQTATGGLKGRIATSNGNPKANVKVTIVNPATGFNRTAVSDSAGNFSFLSIPVGKYDITYSQGSTTFKAARTVALGQEAVSNFLKWPSSDQGATVEIVANAAQTAAIDTASASVGTTVSTELLTSLPLVSRDINEAAVLAPGVQIVAGSNVDPTKKSSTYITTGDGMGRGTSFAVDGADNNSTDVGGSVLYVPIDAIQEFQVVTNQYKAEFGRSTAGFFNVLTKSGTNDWSGIVSAQYTNESLRARRTDEGVKSKDNRGIYAFTVAGPLIKDKLFFMISAERQQGQGAAFDFSSYSSALYPELAGIKMESSKKSVFTKVDWNATQNVQLAVNYGYSQDLTINQGFPRTTTFGGNVPPAALGTSANKTWSSGARLTVNVASNLVFESHFNYFQYVNGIFPKEPGPGAGSPIAVVDQDTPNFPRPDQSNLGWGGIDPNAFQNTGIKRAQWKNELTYILNNHTIKGGVEYQRTTYADQVLFYNETGVYRVFVGSGLNYKSGYDASVQADQDITQIRFVADGHQKGISYKQYGIYAQDDWNINPNWSLYFGARLDWDDQLDYLGERFADIYSTIHRNNPTMAGMNGSAPEGKKYFEPRFQALYRPTGDDTLVFKFGAGRFVANVIDNVTGFSRGLSNNVNGLPNRAYNNAALAYQGMGTVSNADDPRYFNSFKAGTTIGTVNGHSIVLPADFTPYNYAHNVNGLRDYFRTTVNSWLTAATPETGGKSLLSSDFEYPTTTAFNVGVAYRFNDHHAVDATLIYSKSKHLTANPVMDNSGPLVMDNNSSGGLMGDSIFYSNQSASSKQLQVKYAYTGAHTNVIASITFKDNKSSEGGAAGAFDASGSTGGLYGEGAQYAFRSNPERTSAGTEKMLGSFQVVHQFSFGTNLSFLGNWHSGKAYDVTQQYNSELGPGESVDLYHPIEYLGTEYGRWQLDLSMKVSHRFNITKKMAVEPYISVQNLLNNYDYGSNYDGTKVLNSGAANVEFRKRGQSYQSNSPRNAAVGARFTF